MTVTDTFYFFSSLGRRRSLRLRVLPRRRRSLGRSTVRDPRTVAREERRARAIIVREYHHVERVVRKVVGHGRESRNAAAVAEVLVAEQLAGKQAEAVANVLPVVERGGRGHQRERLR